MERGKVSILQFWLTFPPPPRFWWSRHSPNLCSTPDLVHDHTGFGGAVHKMKRKSNIGSFLCKFSFHTAAHPIVIWPLGNVTWPICVLSPRRGSLNSVQSCTDAGLWHHSVLLPLEQRCQQCPHCPTVDSCQFSSAAIRPKQSLVGGFLMLTGWVQGLSW